MRAGRTWFWPRTPLGSVEIHWKERTRTGLNVTLRSRENFSTGNAASTSVRWEQKEADWMVQERPQGWSGGCCSWYHGLTVHSATQSKSFSISGPPFSKRSSLLHLLLDRIHPQPLCSQDLPLRTHTPPHVVH